MLYLGTTKRKELHGTTCARALSGTWAFKCSDVTLNAYKICFHSNRANVDHSNFVLLIEEVLDDDVLVSGIKLYKNSNKLMEFSVFPQGKVQLNVNQVEKSKLFHEFFFNTLFGKLFTGSKSSGIQREFLLKDGNELPWSSSNMYLLLPLEPSSSESHASIIIDWKGIDACASVVNFMRTIYLADGKYFCGSSFLNDKKCEGSDIVHMASESVHTNDLKDMVVLAVHTGRMYTILDVKDDISAESSFNEVNSTQSKFNTFTDYYHQKYNIVLQHPGRPLLLAKQTHHPYNLLIQNFRNEGSKTIVKTTTVHLPPELLVHVNVSTSVLRSFYLLPSVMHTLESMMLASQLRQEISFSHTNHHIPCSLILDALTTLRCCEKHSLERLELLGDSVLKYAVSCHLFFKYPLKQEGELSACRSLAVCNSTLHKLGTTLSIQGYIRDCPFDPRRWVAPGQISFHPISCTCGVETSDVPLGKAYVTEETATVVGKACDMGHRWMCSKTIADCVEALIGAYYVGGGLDAALSLMRWLGIDVTNESLWINKAQANASLAWNSLKANEIDTLESKLKYTFSNKRLLLEAITYSSKEKLEIGCSYQRLEFLGDSVLDILITWYLFQKYTEIDPGELTDLRAATVSNENFALATVRHNLQQHLQNAPEHLLGQITKFVTCKMESNGINSCLPSNSIPEKPKALGDMFESLAGSILVDTDLNIDEVWRVFEPLIPMATPDNLELSPLRELLELCDFLGYPTDTKRAYKEDQAVVEISVQLEDDRLLKCGSNVNSKVAKAHAALSLLNDLKERGILHSQTVSKRKQKEDFHNVESLCSTSNIKMPTLLHDSELSRPISSKKQNAVQHMSLDSFGSSSTNGNLPDHGVKQSSGSKQNGPVVLLIIKEKGGPRTALFELCQISKWIMPKFDCEEEKSRTPMVLNGVTGFNSYTSSITVTIPETTTIKLAGEPRADKKSSRDSAAITMLNELQNMGWCIIEYS